MGLDQTGSGCAKVISTQTNLGQNSAQAQPIPTWAGLPKFFLFFLQSCLPKLVP